MTATGTVGDELLEFVAGLLPDVAPPGETTAAAGGTTTPRRALALAAAAVAVAVVAVGGIVVWQEGQADDAPSYIGSDGPKPAPSARAFRPRPAPR